MSGSFISIRDDHMAPVPRASYIGPATDRTPFSILNRRVVHRCPSKRPWASTWPPGAQVRAVP